MTNIAVSRRNLLATGACALVGAVSLLGPASASALGEQNLTNEELIRKWYAAWEKEGLGHVRSPAGRRLHVFERRGGRPHQQEHVQDAMLGLAGGFIDRFELERVTSGGGRGVREVSVPDEERQVVPERGVFSVQGREVESLECYFGEQSSFPSAVSAGKK